MTRRSILEYARAVRERYRRSTKEAKARILDEFLATTHLHRKAAIRLLNRVEAAAARPGAKKRGWPRLYGVEVTAALKVAYEASDRLCSRRLCPFLGELVRILKAKGELVVSPEAEAQIGHPSPSSWLLAVQHRQDWRQEINTLLPRTASLTSPAQLLIHPGGRDHATGGT